MFPLPFAAAPLLLLPALLLPPGGLAGGRTPPLPCPVARMRCLYRDGCRKALENYVVGCLDVLEGSAKVCNDFCTKSLIALTSTRPGQALMECDCGDDAFCRTSKLRLDPCRPAVQRANRNDTVVSCEVAQWICGADNLCGTALDYYFRNCRAMFEGRHCSRHCNNSISILQRQERAAKLHTCTCEGAGGAHRGCAAIKRNMDRLCFLRGDQAASEVGRSSSATARTVGLGTSRQVAVVWLVFCMRFLGW